MCRDVAAGGRRCPHQADRAARTREDDRTRQQLSRYKRRVALLPERLRHLALEQAEATRPTDDAVRRLRAERRAAPNDASYRELSARIDGAQLALARYRRAEVLRVNAGRVAW